MSTLNPIPKHSPINVNDNTDVCCKTSFPFRQVHLDFHTSGDITGVGDGFDRTKWQETLIQGRVNSITCFATCHHGWSYFDTEIGERHPGLSFDLLAAQFEACKEIGVNVPIYLTAGVNNWASHHHPEWREVGHDGRYLGWTQEVLQPGFHSMCFNTPYLDLLCDQVREVVRVFPGCDGIFLDIITQRACCCRWCLESMESLGLEAACEPDREQHAKLVLDKYYRATTVAARSHDPSMGVFHNSGDLAIGDRNVLDFDSHIELESLPTGGWGYDHFPLTAKYCSNIGKDYLGMTGKFHTTWGEFGGYKHPNALRYECAAMIAMGAKCSIGDQLHPSGQLDLNTYQIIGNAYEEVEAKEPWCANAKPVADIGLLSCEGTNRDQRAARDADTGAARVLLESHMLFDVIDEEMPFESYKLLILPDAVRVSDTLKSKIDAFLADGGKLMLTGDSGFDPTGSECIWDIGSTIEGKSDYQPDYIALEPDVAPSFVTSPLVMYLASNRLRVADGDSMGKVHDPYFNRTYKHFCSHQHAPFRPEPSGYDCGVIHGNIMYLAHPVFTIYRGYGTVAYRQYIVNALRKFMGDELSITTNLPSMARLNLMCQPDRHRHVLHLLYANTINRGGEIELASGFSRAPRGFEIIEDLVPLHTVRTALRLDQPVERVTLEPQGHDIPFAISDDRIEVKVDKLLCHQIVVFHHASGASY